jgi:asparagine synthase (glutamine-hydrolysing)
MCGISGVIKLNSKEVVPSELYLMTDIIQHRGPDDFGYFCFKNVGFGHRRLSILDLSDIGKQPMSYLDRYHITYNGEIYNYLEIRSELLLLGYSFKSETDTEVIMAAYDAWGLKCLQHFNGMWAFALLDKFKEEIVICRDRFGVKPLYYSRTADCFQFGSEIKQLIIEKEVFVNLDVLTEYMLTYVDNHNEFTYFEGINSLLPGHFLKFNINNCEFNIERYYTLNTSSEIQKFSFNEAKRKLNELFESAIKLRLRSDVKVGTCLSGGLDSSCVSAIAKELIGKDSQFIGIHAKSIDIENDESDYAQKVSDYLNIDLHVVTPSTSEFIALVDEVVYTQEEPFGSPSMFMGYSVFKKAKELNCKVMLNGQGGDEVFLGYERYFSSFLLSLSPLKFIKEIIYQSRNSRLKIWDAIAYYFYFTNSFFRIRRLSKRSYLKEAIKSKFQFDELKISASNYKEVTKLQIHEITSMQLPHLLRYEDKNSMRHSIETRLPFLDFNIVEAGVSFRPTFKIHLGWTKYILRSAMERVLPIDILWRKNKLGFNAPERTWLKAHESQMLIEVQNSKILKHITDFEILQKKFLSLNLKDKWMYYNIAVWERVYNVQLHLD